MSKTSHGLNRIIAEMSKAVKLVEAGRLFRFLAALVRKQGG